MNRAAEATMTGNHSIRNGLANILSPDIIRSLREDGAALIKNALNADEMTLVRETYEYHLEHIAPWCFDERTPNSRFVIDPINPDVWESPLYQRLWNETKLPDMAASVFTTPEVWLYYSQVFFKQGSGGERVKRTDWHQDLMLDPIEGSDLLRLWISLEPLDLGYSLELIRGSHRGPIYNAGAYSEEVALTANNGKPMPPLPDIDAERSEREVMTWAVEPGDVLAFHPGVIHGGGPTKPNGTRRTLTMLFFGRDVRYSTRPPPPASLSQSSIDTPDRIVRQRFANVRPGDPACWSTAPRIR